MKSDADRAQGPSPSEGGARRSCTTEWSLVTLAGAEPSADARQALEELCRAYWPSVYAFIRRRGHPAHEAEDLTQGFFEHILAQRDFDDAESTKGRFRTFLVALLVRYLADDRERGNRLNRGGGLAFVALQTGQAEAHVPIEVTTQRTPETEFERRWAETLLERALDRLRREYDAAGSGHRFQTLEPYLVDLKGTLAFDIAATRLGLSESAAKFAAHRLRRRYRKVIRDEIVRTLRSPSEVDDELRHLFAALSQ